MKLILFSKFLKDHDVEALIRRGHDLGTEGYDLCVRPGYVVNPDNAGEMLPSVVRKLAAAGLAVPMVTGNFDLLTPDHLTAEPILAAMDKADVRLLKLGYFRFDPQAQDYWAEVEKARRAFDGWQKLARKYRVKICYHTHSGFYLGNTCAALMLLLQGSDPQLIGAYVDPGHLALEGEPFSIGVSMVRQYLSIVALKDSLRKRADHGDEGAMTRSFVVAGGGMVPWSEVFAELVRVGYDGPLSVHCEFEITDREAFLTAVRREVAYFRRKRDTALAAK